MALFKILKGNSNDLPNVFHEGYMYITQDTGKIYVDIATNSGDEVNSTLQYRIQLNAKYADAIKYIVDGEEITITPADFKNLANEINSNKEALSGFETDFVTINLALDDLRDTDIELRGEIANHEAEVTGLLSAASARITLVEEAQASLQLELDGFETELINYHASLDTINTTIASQS